MSAPITQEFLQQQFEAFAQQIQTHLDNRFTAHAKQLETHLDNRLDTFEERIIDQVSKIVEEGFFAADQKWSERHDELRMEMNARFNQLEERMDYWMPREISEPARVGLLHDDAT